MKTYAVIKNGEVINLVLWDGKSEWVPQEGQAIAIEEGQAVGIGDAYVGGEFVRPGPDATD